MLTYEAFCSECAALVALSQRAACADSASVAWQWQHGARSYLPGNAFLVSTANAREWTTLARSSSSNATHTTNIHDADAFESADLAGDIDDLLAQHENDEVAIAVSPLCLLTNSDNDKQTEIVLCDFHIVYHVIYQTPVLYFRATRLDGSPFRVDTHVSNLQLPGGKRGAAVVSMEEHPVLGTPFWFLHPCETTATMTLLLEQRDGDDGVDAGRQQQQLRSCQPAPYLLAWLSLVAPVTQLNPLDYLHLPAAANSHGCESA